MPRCRDAIAAAATALPCRHYDIAQMLPLRYMFIFQPRASAAGSRLAISSFAIACRFAFHESLPCHSAIRLPPPRCLRQRHADKAICRRFQPLR